MRKKVAGLAFEQMGGFLFKSDFCGFSGKSDLI